MFLILYFFFKHKFRCIVDQKAYHKIIRIFTANNEFLNASILEHNFTISSEFATKLKANIREKDAVTVIR